MARARIRTIGSTSEVCRAWAELRPMDYGLTRNGGRGKKKSMRGEMVSRCNVYREITAEGLHTLYSYGSHFCIGVIIPAGLSHTGNPLVVLNAEVKRSRTTAVHCAEARYALRWQKRYGRDAQDGGWLMAEIDGLRDCHVTDLASVYNYLRRELGGWVRYQYGLAATLGDLKGKRVGSRTYVKIVNGLRERVVNYNSAIQIMPSSYHPFLALELQRLPVPDQWETRWHCVKLTDEERLVKRVTRQLSGKTRRMVFGKLREIHTDGGYSEGVMVAQGDKGWRERLGELLEVARTEWGY